MSRAAARRRDPDEYGPSIVSVGNIEVGGNGKTPLAMHLLSHLAASGKRCAYISRGYRSRSERAPGTTVVPALNDSMAHGHPGVRFIWRGESVSLAMEIGDEGALVALTFPNVTLAFGRDKVASLSVLSAIARPDVVVLDDAFQSWAVPRHIDVVLVDAERPFGPGGLLPMGTLREHPRSLTRADVVLANGLKDVDSIDAVRAAVERDAGPVRQFGGVVRSMRLVSPSGDSIAHPGQMVVVSGIARPRRLEADIGAMGIHISTSLRYPDHHRFSVSDGDHIAAAVARSGVDGIITTEKDWVKLRGVIPSGVPVWIAALDVSVVGIAFEEMLKT